MQKAWKILREGGPRALHLAVLDKLHAGSYQRWIAEFDTLTDADRAQIRARIQALPRRPRISVLMPVYDAPEEWLRRAIGSVRAQLYPHWELCIADDASTLPHVREVLDEAAASDERIRVVYRSANGHIAAASNSALELATGELVALLDQDDELAPHALYLLAEHGRDADIIYSDEDKLDASGRRYEPHFKPDWNPDLLFSQNYLSHLGAYRTSLVREAGGFRLDGSQDYDLALRLSARTSRIVHVPHVLYHWRATAGSAAATPAAKPYAREAAMRALRERLGVPVTDGDCPGTYRVRHPLPAAPPLVSIVIPTRDHGDLLERCVGSIEAKTAYARREILIVDNDSSDPAALALLQDLERSGRARILRDPRPFNYAAINNAAVREARGEVLAFLNNDVEVLAPEWLDELVAHALRPEVGAAGAKLLYPDGTVQHAGIVTGLYGLAGHAWRRMPGDAPGPFCRIAVVQDVSAVTGACMVMRRSVFEEAGGFDAGNLPVAFNDVDLCLRLRERGLRIVWTPFARLIHHEFASRGADDTAHKRERFARETAYMLERWKGRLEDPFYNPNLSLRSDLAELAWPTRAPKPWRATS